MRKFWLTKVLYSKESLEEVEKIRLKIPTLFKHRPMVKGITIDGEHSPDLDDAIWARRTPFGYMIDVHIADLGSVITPQSPLFIDAVSKKESKYYEDSIDHMFPPALSENLFSLLQGQKRLTITIRTELNRDLDIINYRIFPSTLTSQKRLSHGQASELIRRAEDPLGKMLKLSYQLATGLMKKRFSKTPVSLMDVEAGNYLDKYGKARQLKQSSNSATLLIQALMVLSNEMVSQYFIQKNLPGIFRNHLPKNKNEIKEIMKNIIENNGHDPDPRWLAQLSKSFLKAKYQIKNKGHKGLLIDSYLHFYF
jgi:ribonuclease R